MAENGVTDGRLASGVRPVKSSVDEDECDERYATIFLWKIFS